MTRPHELIAEHLDDDAVDAKTSLLAPGRVVIGIETDRGPWVTALIAAGYVVFAINPVSAARYAVHELSDLPIARWLISSGDAAFGLANADPGRATNGT